MTDRGETAKKFRRATRKDNENGREESKEEENKQAKLVKNPS